MEAVPTTGGARRTVRLATALVAGQIVLVTVVGWLIAAHAGDASGPARAPAVERLAAPRAPIAPVPPAPSAAPPRSLSETSPASPSARHAVTGTGRPPAAPAGRAPAPRGTPAAPAPPASPSGPLTLVPPVGPAVTVPAVPASPDPVLPGRPCPRKYALTRADDGHLVRCLPTRHRQLRWKIV